MRRRGIKVEMVRLEPEEFRFTLQSKPGWSSYCLYAISGPLPAFINKVLLEFV
jgi:hypothetical protein